MGKQKKSIQQVKILDELIDTAIELPIESQDLLLMLAKSMAFTRSCLINQNMIEDSKMQSVNHTA